MKRYAGTVVEDKIERPCKVCTHKARGSHGIPSDGGGHPKRHYNSTRPFHVSRGVQPHHPKGRDSGAGRVERDGRAILEQNRQCAIESAGRVAGTRPRVDINGPSSGRASGINVAEVPRPCHPPRHVQLHHNCTGADYHHAAAVVQWYGRVRRINIADHKRIAV